MHNFFRRLKDLLALRRVCETLGKHLLELVDVGGDAEFVERETGTLAGNSALATIQEAVLKVPRNNYFVNLRALFFVSLIEIYFFSLTSHLNPTKLAPLLSTLHISLVLHLHVGGSTMARMCLPGRWAS